jgi:hypothetical protein
MATQTVTTSKQFTFSMNDVWKGLLVAVITPVITIIMNSLEAGSLTFNWKAIGITALTAGLAYVLKNFFTPAKIVVTGAAPETVQAVKDGDIDVKVDNVVAKVTPQ